MALSCVSRKFSTAIGAEHRLQAMNDQKASERLPQLVGDGSVLLGLTHRPPVCGVQAVLEQGLDSLGRRADLISYGLTYGKKSFGLV